MVSAFSTRLSVVVGDVVLEPDQNEITAALALLKQLPLDGAIVTGDAIFCQREICTAITAGGGDYAFVVKDNQPELKSAIAEAFVELSPCDPPPAVPAECGFPGPLQVQLIFSAAAGSRPGRMLNIVEVLRKYGDADVSLRRLEDYEWFVRMGIARFEQKVQDLIGAFIERGNNASRAPVSEAAEFIRHRIQNLMAGLPDRARSPSKSLSR